MVSWPTTGMKWTDEHARYIIRINQQKVVVQKLKSLKTLILSCVM